VARRFGLVVNATIGLFALGSGLFVTQLAWQGRVLSALFGVFWLGMLAVVVSLQRGRTGARARTRRWDGLPATVIDLRHEQMWAFLYVCAGFGSFFVVATALALGAGSSSWIVCAALAAFFLSVALEVVLALRRGAFVALTAGGIGYRDWSYEHRLDWSAIAVVSASLPGGQPAIRIDGPVTSTSRRLVWRLSRRPVPGAIEIEARQIVPYESALFDAINRYRDEPVHRDEPGTEAGLAVLGAR
jgi:hypothetical protein